MDYNNLRDFMDSSVYQIKKSRGINWTPEEKEYLFDLCRQRVRVIEDKKSDLLTLSKKAAAWKFIHTKFSVRFGRKRTPIRIKEQWKRMKIAARAELRDRGLQPEQGVTPLDPNVPTTRYYGESPEIIAKVQDLLFNSTDQNDGDDAVDLNETEEIHEEIITDIKIEPYDEFTMEIQNQLENEERNRQDSSSRIRPEEDSSSPTNPCMYVYENGINSSHKPGSSHINDERRDKESAFSNSHPSIHQQRSTPTQARQSTSSQGRFAQRQPVKVDETKTPTLPSIEARLTDAQILEFACIEHNRKMEIMEEEHALQMEVLNIQREVALAKLKRANMKINSYSQPTC